jgi:hypothetical protein
MQNMLTLQAPDGGIRLTAVISFLCTLAVAYFHVLPHFGSCISFRLHVKYRPLLKRKQLTCTAWVESISIRDDGRGENIYILSKNVSVTAWPSFRFVYKKTKNEFMHSEILS